MAMKLKPILLLILALLVPLVLSDVFGGRKAAGGYQTITVVSAPEVQRVGQYSVTAHNTATGASLQYVGVVSSQSMHVSATVTEYRLIVQTREGSSDIDEYEAVVFDRSGSFTLNSFTLAAG
ncbi:hypothetical protein Vadar_022632 [Vaccinium darrowii]|uniref:Uncharacterized protein n=1 Tax=Vaccinium darrowii TaxID=229202 RepID=A0ACB7XBT5_9ERIC|nr:hypothetical protein Vadar_022632 [Vaccinium darrowii]